MSEKKDRFHALHPKLESKVLCRISKKFSTNKLPEIDLSEFHGIGDYLLLSGWLGTQNVPLKVTKRNYFTKHQRFLSNLMTQGNNDDVIIQAIKLISKKQHQGALKSISTLNQLNKTKEMHSTVKSLMKLKIKTPMTKGI